MEDTLRYFFRAVFQGFAAVTTLGIMFYLYYLDKFRKRVEDIESIFQGFKPNPGTEDNLYVKEHGFVMYVKDKVLPKKEGIQSYDFARKAVSLYEAMVLQKDRLNKKLMKLFKIAVLIILTSLISLFCVGYIVWLNKLLFILGILAILLSFIFFIQLFMFIKDITESN
jgi:hypothetical protein